MTGQSRDEEGMMKKKIAGGKLAGGIYTGGASLELSTGPSEAKCGRSRYACHFCFQPPLTSCIIIII